MKEERISIAHRVTTRALAGRGAKIDHPPGAMTTMPNAATGAIHLVKEGLLVPGVFLL